MTHFTAGYLFEEAIAKALGLNVATIDRLEIVTQAGELPAITVHQFLESDKEIKLISVFRLSEWKAES